MRAALLAARAPLPGWKQASRRSRHVLARDDEEKRTVTVLHIDEREGGPGPDCLLADGSLSGHEIDLGRLLSGLGPRVR
jgi:hypothetical protein